MGMEERVEQLEGVNKGLEGRLTVMEDKLNELEESIEVRIWKDGLDNMEQEKIQNDVQTKPTLHPCNLYELVNLNDQLLKTVLTYRRGNHKPLRPEELRIIAKLFSDTINVNYQD